MTYTDCVRRFGLAFYPEKHWYEYSDHPNGFGTDRAAGEAFDDIVQQAFIRQPYEKRLDPYAAALAVWYEDGLLGANDPGPPAFRNAHERWLLSKPGLAPDTSDIPEATTASDYPRPRLPLQELLDTIMQFQHHTSALRINTRTHSTFGEMERVFNIHRDALVAWFAARGVDIDAEK